MAMRFRISRSWRRAVVAVSLSIAACAPSVESVMEKAKADRDKGDNVSAAISLKSILASHPKNQELYFRTGVVLADLGELVNAENALRRGHPPQAGRHYPRTLLRADARAA